MLKFDPKTPNTDNGWVYGTVTPSNETSANGTTGEKGQFKVTSAGKIASCIACHESAEHDRVFGLKHLAPVEDNDENKM